MVVFVLNDPDRSQDVLDAWEAAGIIGVTILESSGLGRVRRAGVQQRGGSVGGAPARRPS